MYIYKFKFYDFFVFYNVNITGISLKVYSKKKKTADTYYAWVCASEAFRIWRTMILLSKKNSSYVIVLKMAFNLFNLKSSNLFPT